MHAPRASVSARILLAAETVKRRVYERLDLLSLHERQDCGAERRRRGRVRARRSASRLAFAPERGERGVSLWRRRRERRAWDGVGSGNTAAGPILRASGQPARSRAIVAHPPTKGRRASKTGWGDRHNVNQACQNGIFICKQGIQDLDGKNRYILITSGRSSQSFE